MYYGFKHEGYLRSKSFLFLVLANLRSLVHLQIGSRYAVQRSGNVLMAFNNKEASSAIPLFSPVLVPMAQSFGPLLSDIFSSPTLHERRRIEEEPGKKNLISFRAGFGTLRVLTEYAVQDLNVNPKLPFEDKSFNVITNVKLELVNGVLFTGGWAKNGSYFEAVRTILAIAISLISNTPSPYISLAYKEGYVLQQQQPKSY
ncbi:hypothetical protein RYX36_036586 [Vicia faba]